MHRSFMRDEIASQPDCWRRAASFLREKASVLPKRDESVAVIGCGTSWFMAMAYAAQREKRGDGLTDAFPASEFPKGRAYDRILAITRSGTTTEVLDVLDHMQGRIPTVAITADPKTPVCDLADAVIALEFADERSVVQTRFATTVLVFLRASLGDDTERLALDGTKALDVPIESMVTASQFTFLGAGWTIGLAHEAALKLREAARVWTESYPAMEYRHGPVSVAEPGRLVWMFGDTPAGLAHDVSATGATFVQGQGLDPLAQLVIAQRLANAIAEHYELDPDRPRNLTRSVILQPSST